MNKTKTLGLLRTMEREVIMATLKECGGNVAAAARKLGISPRQVRYRLKRYGYRVVRPAKVVRVGVE